MSNEPECIKILEQPATRKLRFRYECEKRSHGSLMGVGSTPRAKKYPKISIVGLQSDAHVLVSCVTKDKPYRVHPHALTSKNRYIKNGVFVTKLRDAESTVTLKNIGIQCARKRDIAKALAKRREIRVDPFNRGFNHGSEIDLSAVRLCVQVLMHDPVGKRYTRQLRPIVSEPIYDKQPTPNLTISYLSANEASAAGGTPVMIFSTKVIKDDIKVRFFELDGGRVLWEAHVHPARRVKTDNQKAITIITPQFRLPDVSKPVPVMIQLMKRSNGASGESFPFKIVPPSYLGEEPNIAPAIAPVDLSGRRKRRHVDSSTVPSSSSVSNVFPPIPLQPNSAGHANQSSSEYAMHQTKKAKQSHPLYLPAPPPYPIQNPFFMNQMIPPSFHNPAYGSEYNHLPLQLFPVMGQPSCCPFPHGTSFLHPAPENQVRFHDLSYTMQPEPTLAPVRVNNACHMGPMVFPTSLHDLPRSSTF